MLEVLSSDPIDLEQKSDQSRVVQHVYFQQATPGLLKIDPFENKCRICRSPVFVPLMVHIEFENWGGANGSPVRAVFSHRGIIKIQTPPCRTKEI